MIDKTRSTTELIPQIREFHPENKLNRCNASQRDNYIITKKGLYLYIYALVLQAVLILFITVIFYLFDVCIT